MSDTTNTDDDETASTRETTKHGPPPAGVRVGEPPTEKIFDLVPPRREFADSRVIEMLERALVAARDGEVSTCAVVFVDAGGATRFAWNASDSSDRAVLSYGLQLVTSDIVAGDMASLEPAESE